MFQEKKVIYIYILLYIIYYIYIGAYLKGFHWTNLREFENQNEE